MKVYIASRFELKGDALLMKQMVESLGHTVTSRWLGDSRANTRNAAIDGLEQTCQEMAKEDLEDIESADVVLALNPPESVGVGRGGRHFEVGYAYAIDKPVGIYWVRENVFHYLEGITYLKTREALLEWLAERSAAVGR